MRKFMGVWRDQERWHAAVNVAGRWAACQVVKEILRLALELWLQT
ncbi:hypothetical protein AB4225_27330 [Streptomyces sp. 2RAF24]